LTLDEVTEIGCRIHMLERAFNCWEGLRRKDDRLPPRFLHKDIPSRNSKGLRTKPEELQEMLAYNVSLYKYHRQEISCTEVFDNKFISQVEPIRTNYFRKRCTKRYIGQGCSPRARFGCKKKLSPRARYGDLRAKFRSQFCWRQRVIPVMGIRNIQKRMIEGMKVLIFGVGIGRGL